MNNKETMEQKNNRIPELRFPEFVKDGVWEENKIDSLFDLQDGYAFSSFDFTEIKENSKQVIRITDINNQNKNSEKVFLSEKRIKELDIDKYKVKKGDLLLSLTGAAGFNFFIWNSSEAYINQRTMKIFSKNPLNKPLVFLLEPLISEQINSIGTGQNNNLSKDALKEIKINFPKPKEQQKIADCLTSLDELITAHSDKLEILKNHKKGLLQNLFPQEGQKVPNYRFPEFVNDGEWDFLDGNNLFDSISNKNHNSDLPILAITQEHGAIPRDRINYNVVVTDKSVESYKVVEIGDFIISLRSFQGGIEYSNYKGICSPAYIILRKKNDYLVNDFYKFYFKTSLYIKNLNRNLEGIRDGKMISYNQFSEIKLPNPNPKEQQKIADCLMAVDNLITRQTEKIEQLKNHKKGLMQGLFP